MIIGVLLGPGVVTVLALIVVATARIEWPLAKMCAIEGEAAEHSP